MDEDSEDHRAAAGVFPDLLDRGLVTHNYVVVEAVSLVQRRLAPVATRALLEDLLPSFSIVWVDEVLHGAAESAMLAALRRRASLVDWVSFEVMRRRGIEVAFAFDRDFRNQGFEMLP